MLNKLSIIIYAIACIFCFSCTKSKPDPPVKIDSTKKEVDETGINNGSKIIKKGTVVEISDFKIYDDNAENFYIGSLWNLKDTSKFLNIVPIPNKELKDTKTSIFSPSNFSADIANFVPSYNEMFSYAKKFTVGSSTLSSLNNSSFFDYATLQYYIANRNDYEIIKSLVAVNDSTYIRKKYGIVNHSKLEYLTLFTDIVEFSANYDQSFVKKVKSENINPHYLSSVTFGFEYALYAESDSTKASFNRVLEKLLNKTSLNRIDEEVLKASNLLIYRRDSANKDSFIKYAKGMSEIKGAVGEFLKINSDSALAVKYPLSFTLTSLDDFSSLKYNLKFDVIVKEQ